MGQQGHLTKYRGCSTAVGGAALAVNGMENISHVFTVCYGSLGESECAAGIVIVLRHLADFSQSAVIAQKETWSPDFSKYFLPGLQNETSGTEWPDAVPFLAAGGRRALFGWDPQEYLDTYRLARPHSGPECPTAKRQLSSGIHLRG
jgi:hypothetical protein